MLKFFAVILLADILQKIGIGYSGAIALICMLSSQAIVVYSSSFVGHIKQRNDISRKFARYVFAAIVLSLIGVFSGIPFMASYATAFCVFAIVDAICVAEEMRGNLYQLG